mgnify:CR=1 FL=1
MGGTAEFVTRNGQRVTLWMAYQIDRLAQAFWLRFGLLLLVMSGIRTYQEQVDIFLSRYVTASNINGRKVYDTRVWNGTRYYRISAAGTVAVPGTSNHEIQGSNAAVDFGDSGRDPGVSVANTERANWLKANAPAYDLIPEGYNFREPWHYLALNIFNTPPASGGGIAPVQHWKEADMRLIWTTDKKGWLVGPGAVVHVLNPDDMDLLRRMLESDPSDADTFTPSQAATIDSYMAKLVDRSVMNSATFLNVIEGNKKKTYVVGAGGKAVHVLNPSDLNLLIRFFASGTGAVDTVTRREFDIIMTYVEQIG